MEEKIYCKNCGAEVNGAFCISCGAPAAPVQADVPVAEPVVEETVQAPLAEQPADEIPVVEPTLPPVKNPGTGFGIVSMILGIVGLVINMVCCCIMPYVGILLGAVCAIVAIIFGVMGGKKSAEAGFTNGMAKTGKILGIITLVLIVLAIVAVILLYVFGLSMSFLPAFIEPSYY